MGIAVSPVGNFAYVETSAGVSRINLDTNRVATTIAIPNEVLVSVVFDSTGSFAYVPTGLSGYLVKSSTAPVATIGRITPSAGPTSGGNRLTITGNYSSPGAIVTFGTSACTNVRVVNRRTITCASPPHSIGSADVTVSAPGGAAAVPHGFANVRTLSSCPIQVSARPANAPVFAVGSRTRVTGARTGVGCRLNISTDARVRSTKPRGDLRPPTFAINPTTGAVTVTTHGISTPIHVTITATPQAPGRVGSRTWERTWSTR